MGTATCSQFGIECASNWTASTHGFSTIPAHSHSNVALTSSASAYIKDLLWAVSPEPLLETCVSSAWYAFSSWSAESWNGEVHTPITPTITRASSDAITEADSGFGGFSYLPVSPCCGQCYVSAPGKIELVYWPTPAVDPGLTTISRGTFTFTSPTQYIIFTSLFASNACGTQGTGVTSQTLGFTPGQLSSILRWISGDVSTTTDITTAITFSDIGIDCATLTDGPELDQYTTINNNVYHDRRCFPYIHVPPAAVALNTEWATCTGLLTGAYDPPIPLTPQSSLLPQPKPQPPSPTPALPTYATTYPASTAQATNPANNPPKPTPKPVSKTGEMNTEHGSSIDSSFNSGVFNGNSPNNTPQNSGGPINNDNNSYSHSSNPSPGNLGHSSGSLDGPEEPVQGVRPSDSFPTSSDIGFPGLSPVSGLESKSDFKRTSTVDVGVMVATAFDPLATPNRSPEATSVISGTLTIVSGRSTLLTVAGGASPLPTSVSILVLDGTTTRAGQPAATINGILYTTNGDVVKTWSRVSEASFLDQQSILPGGSSLTFSQTPVSMATNGNLIVENSNIAPDGAPVTVDGQESKLVEGGGLGVGGVPVALETVRSSINESKGSTEAVATGARPVGSIQAAGAAKIGDWRWDVWLLVVACVWRGVG